MERRRDKLIYEIIVDRFEQEKKRANDLDSKANSVIGFAGILTTLTVGISELPPETQYKNLFLVPMTIFIFSAIFGLFAYWLTSYSAINPESLIREYANRTETEVLRTFVATTSVLTMDNFQRNQRKVVWLYTAFVLLVLAIGLFFVITTVNIMK